MKKKGCTSDFIPQRNSELRAAFFNQDAYSTADPVMQKTVKSPASRFWVDPERARDVISRMEKDPSSTKGMLPERQRMYKDLYKRYQEIRRQFPQHNKIEAVTIAIYAGAPEFYLSPSRARYIVYGGPAS